MRNVFLSLLLHVFGTPVLGLPTSVSSASHALGKLSYPPQLHLNCTLHLRDVANAEGGRIYLEDVASCEGPSGLCREALSIEAGLSPKPGQELRMKSQDLQSLVQAELPQHKFKFTGPTEVRVRAGFQVIDQAKLRKLIEDRLSRQDGRKSLRFLLQSLRVPQLTYLRHNDYSYSFPDFDEQLQRLYDSPRRSHLSLKVRAEDARASGGESFEWSVQVTLKAELLAVLAKRDLPRGTLVQEGDVLESWIPFQENVVREKSELQGKSLRMSVRAGQTLRSFELAQEPDVRRGDRVEAAVLSSGVKMDASGQAMETGVVGQKIRVQLDSTKRQVMGLIVARAQVEVHLP